MADYLFVVSMDVEPEYEDLFNEVYDEEHIPYLQTVPGVHAVRRYKSEPFALAIAGEMVDYPPAAPHYVAHYEVDGPHVLASAQWAEAVEKGRWAPEVRPRTHNRAHALYKIR